MPENSGLSLFDYGRSKEKKWGQTFILDFVRNTGVIRKEVWRIRMRNSEFENKNTIGAECRAISQPHYRDLDLVGIFESRMKNR